MRERQLAVITDTNRISFLLAQGAFKSREEIDGLMVKEATDDLIEPVRPADDDEPRPPLRFCTRCGAPIDPKRVMRGSPFCDTPCRREDLKERRSYRASKACRLCGRPAKHRKPQIVSSEVCDGGTARESVSQQLPDNAEFIR